MNGPTPRSCLLILFLAVTVLGGCYRMNLYAPNTSGELPTKKAFLDIGNESRWSHSVIGGIVQIKAVEIEEICKDSDYQAIQMRSTFFNMVVQNVTYNIYTPQTVRVVCREAPGRATAP